LQRKGILIDYKNNLNIRGMANVGMVMEIIIGLNKG
jgi:hypothetical protein